MAYFQDGKELPSHPLRDTTTHTFHPAASHIIRVDQPLLNIRPKVACQIEVFAFVRSVGAPKSVK
jgi:hypothetical protein